MQFMRDLFDGSIAFAEGYTCCDPHQMTINTVQMVRLAEIVLGIRVGDGHKVTHDVNNFIGLQKRISTCACLGWDPLIDAQRFVLRDV